MNIIAFKSTKKDIIKSELARFKGLGPVWVKKVDVIGPIQSTADHKTWYGYIRTVKGATASELKRLRVFPNVTPFKVVGDFTELATLQGVAVTAHTKIYPPQQR